MKMANVAVSRVCHPIAIDENTIRSFNGMGYIGDKNLIDSRLVLLLYLSNLLNPGIKSRMKM